VQGTDHKRRPHKSRKIEPPPPVVRADAPQISKNLKFFASEEPPCPKNVRTGNPTVYRRLLWTAPNENPNFAIVWGYTQNENHWDYDKIIFVYAYKYKCDATRNRIFSFTCLSTSTSRRIKKWIKPAFSIAQTLRALCRHKSVLQGRREG